jgi:hypothetical protein
MDHKFNRHEYFSGLLLQIKYDAFSIFVDSLYTFSRPAWGVYWLQIKDFPFSIYSSLAANISPSDGRFIESCGKDVSKYITFISNKHWISFTFIHRQIISYNFNL